MHLKCFQGTPQVTQELLWYRLAAKIPDHGAQLGMRMEGQTVINPPDVTIFTAQAMTGFAVGIIRNQIKKRYLFDFILMLLAQTKIISILLAVVDVELHRSDTIRSIANHRGRNELPAQDFTERKAARSRL